MIDERRIRRLHSGVVVARSGLIGRERTAGRRGDGRLPLLDLLLALLLLLQRLNDSLH